MFELYIQRNCNNGIYRRVFSWFALCKRVGRMEFRFSSGQKLSKNFRYSDSFLFPSPCSFQSRLSEGAAQHFGVRLGGLSLGGHAGAVGNPQQLGQRLSHPTPP